MKPVVYKFGGTALADAPAIRVVIRPGAGPSVTAAGVMNDILSLARLAR